MKQIDEAQKAGAPKTECVRLPTFPSVPDSLEKYAPGPVRAAATVKPAATNPERNSNWVRPNDIQVGQTKIPYWSYRKEISIFCGYQNPQTNF